MCDPATEGCFIGACEGLDANGATVTGRKHGMSDYLCRKCACERFGSSSMTLNIKESAVTVVSTPQTEAPQQSIVSILDAKVKAMLKEGVVVVVETTSQARLVILSLAEVAMVDMADKGDSSDGFKKCAHEYTSCKLQGTALGSLVTGQFISPFVISDTHAVTLYS